MDPFTAITGAAGLISTVQGILNKLKPYYKGWKDCPQELTELRNELKDLKALLRNVQPGVSRLSASDSINRNAVQPQAVVDLLRLVEETKKLLEPYQGPEKIDQVYETPDKKKRLRWKNTKEEVQPLKRRIASCLEGLGLAIAADTSSGVIDANEKLQTIEEARIEEAAKAKQKVILDWLSPEDPGARHNEVRALRGEGTGRWFYNTEQFKSWYENKDSSSNWLWCRGNPGAGKTFIMSNIVDHISDRFKGETFGIAYAYCNYGDADTQNPVRIFGSILRQLGGLKKRIFPQIEALHKTLSPTSRKPTLQELLEVLKTVLKEFTRVWFFFDALDECSEDHRRTILSSLKDLTVPSIQFFATSRPYVDMSSAKGAKVLDISANRGDIEMFIRKKAATYDLEEEFIGEIIEKVIKKSDGMFLLAKYQTDHIFRGRNPKKMKANFDDMPKDIGQFFAAAMGRIAKQDDSDKKLALNALMWISKAIRPLHIDELSAALAFGEGNHTTGDMYDRSDVENACLGLAIVDEATGVCRLAHYTVQEYLISLPEFMQQANLLLARTCLRYITLEVFEEGTGPVRYWLSVRIEEYKLYDYAVRNWAIHMRSSGEEQGLITMVDKAFRNGKAIESAMKVIMSDTRNRPPYEAAVFFGRLHTAAYWGLSQFAQHILSDTKDVNLSDMYSRTPLSWAAENGHEAVVKLLVETEGVDVNSKGEYGRSPLSFAAQRGHEAVVKLLVGTERVDVDSKDSSYGKTPLSWAAENGHGAVVKFLVGTRGVDVNFKDDSGRSPLFWAAENGQEAVVKFLVGTNGVDVDSKNENGRSPLTSAAQHGYEGVVKLLVGTKGVDVDLKDTSYGQTPLCWAAEYGHEAVVKLLVGTEGVDVNSKSKSGRSPLSWAAENGHEAVVKLLVETEGVDVNSKDTSYGQTPLYWAAENGHEAVVKLLVGTEGVDVNSKSKSGRSPLSWAAGNGHEAVVKLLVETEGVDVNSKSEYGRSPLSFAAQRGHEAVVKLLVGTKGVDVDLKDTSYGQTPLCWAAEYGHEAVVKLLVGTEGVDVNSKSKSGQSPLSWAAEWGHEAVVKFLVGIEGVDVDSKDKNGRSPLSWAAEYGQEVVVEFLVRTKGVDVDSKHKNGRSPLSWAAGKGHRGVVKLLVETEGVDQNSKHKSGWSPLSWAAKNGHEAVVKILVGTKGVDVDLKDNSGQSPLSLAAQYGHEVVVKLLLGTEGVDLDSIDNSGQSPLSWAAKNGHGRVVKLFPGSGKADLDIDMALWPESEHSNLGAIKTIEDAKDKTELSRDSQLSQPTQSEVLDTVAMHPTTSLLPGTLLPWPSTLVLIPPFFYPAIFRGKYFILIFWITSCFSLLLLFFFFY